MVRRGRGFVLSAKSPRQGEYAMELKYRDPQVGDFVVSEACGKEEIAEIISAQVYHEGTELHTWDDLYIEYRNTNGVTRYLKSQQDRGRWVRSDALMGANIPLVWYDSQSRYSDCLIPDGYGGTLRVYERVADPCYGDDCNGLMVQKQSYTWAGTVDKFHKYDWSGPYSVKHFYTVCTKCDRGSFG
jgi:hypothetical protein